MTSWSRDSAGPVVGIPHDLSFDLVLVDELENVRRVDEDGRGAGDGDSQK